MQTGIMGFKGRIHYHCAPCIDAWLKEIAPDTPKTELFSLIATHIDKEIHANYRLYPINFVALDMLEGGNAHAAEYSADDKATFEKYLAGQMAKIQLPNKDDKFLLDCMLRMYANPAINKLAIS